MKKLLLIEIFLAIIVIVSNIFTKMEMVICLDLDLQRTKI